MKTIKITPQSIGVTEGKTLNNDEQAIIDALLECMENRDIAIILNSAVMMWLTKNPVVIPS